MNVNTPQVSGTGLELLADSPMVRVTAGAGSAGQKTWNLRRPVTLIGARRPAHIVLHDRNVSAAHCVIVNTGTDILLKDLHTSNGTLRNSKPVDLVLLNDGDVVTVGETRIQIAIRVPEDKSDDSTCGLKFLEPTKLPKPVNLQLDHTDTRWRIEDAVTLIGRHNNAPIRLDHNDVAARHAVLFRFGGELAVFGLTNHVGVSVNGEPCSAARVPDAVRVGIGPLTLLVNHSGGSALELVSPIPAKAAGPNGRSQPNQQTGEALPPTPQTTAPIDVRRPESQLPATPRKSIIDLQQPPSLDEIGAELSSLQHDIANSWDRLNTWESQLQESSSQLDKRRQDLTERAQELDTKDAALRGHLHDITQFSEQVAARERDLAAQLACIQEQRDSVNIAQTELAKREEAVARQAEELRRREHVVAQRWARIQAATCPHCRKSLRG